MLVTPLTDLSWKPFGNSLCTLFCTRSQNKVLERVIPVLASGIAGARRASTPRGSLDCCSHRRRLARRQLQWCTPSLVCLSGQDHRQTSGGSRTRGRPRHLDENWWHARWHFDVAQRMVTWMHSQFCLAPGLAQTFPYIFSSIRTQLNCWSLRITEPFTCLCWHRIATWSKPVSRYKLNVTASCTRVNLNSFWE